MYSGGVRRGRGTSCRGQIRRSRRDKGHVGSAMSWQGRHWLEERRLVVGCGGKGEGEDDGYQGSVDITWTFDR